MRTEAAKISQAREDTARKDVETKSGDLVPDLVPDYPLDLVHLFLALITALFLDGERCWPPRRWHRVLSRLEATTGRAGVAASVFAQKMSAGLVDAGGGSFGLSVGDVEVGFVALPAPAGRTDSGG